MKAPRARYRLTMPTPAVNVLLAQEIHPPEGQEPIEWLLITTLPIPAFADAQQIVLWYPFRWRIERFHYTVKTGGCYGERLQWERFAR